MLIGKSFLSQSPDSLLNTNFEPKQPCDIAVIQLFCDSVLTHWKSMDIIQNLEAHLGNNKEMGLFKKICLSLLEYANRLFK